MSLDPTLVFALLTVSVAIATAPLPPFDVVTVLVVLFLTPAVAPVTVTEKIQFALVAKEGLVNEMTFAAML